jgi:hypothetical protein
MYEYPLTPSTRARSILISLIFEYIPPLPVLNILLVKADYLQISHGSVWTVGGLAPFSFGVSNGRGGLTGSGTNAPLYTTTFSSSIPKAEEDREKHEGRLAKALELDRTQRIHHFVDPNILPRSISMRKKHTGFETKTVWNGSQWALDGQHASGFLANIYFVLLPESDSMQKLRRPLSQELFQPLPSNKFSIFYQEHC